MSYSSYPSETAQGITQGPAAREMHVLARIARLEGDLNALAHRVEALQNWHAERLDRLESELGIGAPPPSPAPLIVPPGAMGVRG
jgi:hypothetical protein